MNFCVQGERWDISFHETVKDYFNVSNDWNFSQTLSKNQEISTAQYDMRNALIEMVNQIDEDRYYERSSSLFKYKIPYDILNRDNIIDEKQELMGGHVTNFIRAYEKLRNYVI